jgi:iron complex outermembrane receptor protein
MTLRAGMAVLGLFLCVFSAIGQEKRVNYKGKIYDAESNLPLIGAVITLQTDPISRTLSMADGTFEVEDWHGEELLAHISYLGYKTQSTKLVPGDANSVFLEPEETSLAEVEIRGEKIRDGGTKSLAISTIGTEEISMNTTASLGSLLAGVQGVSFASFGSNIQLPIIHGLYGNRILVLNNGFKHGFQNWGSDHAPEIDIQSAASIAVVKGAAAVRYGPDALGGAVVTESHTLPFSKKMNGNMNLGYQSNGRGANASFNLSEGYEDFSWNIGGKVNMVGDRNTPDYHLTNTGAREYSFYSGAKYRLKDNLILRGNYSFMRQNLGILRASVGSSGAALIRNFEAERPVIIRDFSYAINEPNQFISHHLASLKLDWNINEDNHVAIRYAFQSNAREEYDVRRNADLPIIDLNLFTQDLQADWNHKLTERISGEIGGQVLLQSNDNNPGTSVTPFIPNYESFRASAFWVET